jgi:hypothetical protein
MITLNEIVEEITHNFKQQRLSQGFYVPISSLFSPSLSFHIKERKLTTNQINRLMLLAIDKLPTLEYSNEERD